MSKENRNLRLELIKEKQRLEEQKHHLERKHSLLGLDPRAEIALKENQIKYLEEQIGSFPLSEEIAADKSAGTSNPISWQGSKIEFAELVLGLYKKGQIKAISNIDALTQAARYFVDRNGKSFKPRSLWQAIQNKKDYTK
jgi:hypothetical protein